MRAWAALVVCVGVVARVAEAAGAVKPPNIIIFLADDLGIGDLGCYGNHSIRTPNIDRLASEGVRLTHHIAASALCTPSRVALLTGRYPTRLGLEEDLHLPIPIPVFLHVTSEGGLPEDEVTVASALEAANYTTAIVGKWHLGMNCSLFGRSCPGPLKHGFQSFFGIPVSLFQEFRGPHPFWIFPLDNVKLQGLALAGAVALVSLAVARRTGLLGPCATGFLLLVTGFVFGVVWFFIAHGPVAPWIHYNFNSLLMSGEEVVESPIQLDGLSQRLTEESRSFLAAHAHDDRPFFLYHAFAHVHTPMFSAPHMTGKSKHGRYGDNVEEMDESVGAVLSALTELGLEDNTLVYFASDQGGHLEATDESGQRVGGHNGHFKGGKRQGGSEGGIRVPGIFRWPGHLPRGASLAAPFSLLDVLPTLLSLAGLPPLSALVPRAKDKELDGMDLSGLLKEAGAQGGQGVKQPSRVLLHHCGVTIHAARLVTDEHVYKMHLVKPKWFEGSTQCGWGHLKFCSCSGEEKVIDLTAQPELYDLTTDPYEDQPIAPQSEEYKAVVGELTEYLRKWKARVHYPPSQFSSPANFLWRPWYQPHCSSC